MLELELRIDYDSDDIAKRIEENVNSYLKSRGF